MSHARWITALASLFGLLAVVACGGLGPSQGDPQVASELAAIEPTRIDGVDSALSILTLDGAGPPPMSSGSGLQVVQVAPLGQDRKALQAAVVFDRPMVALTALDTMIESVPLSCEAEGVELQLKPRWAGTSTAVVLPDNEEKAFPNATRITCTVPEGTRALDGTTLENAITWTFETPRPRVTRTVPTQLSENVRLDEPLFVWFNQPVDAQQVAPFLELRPSHGGAAVPITVEPAEKAPTGIAVRHGGLELNTPYTLTVRAGLPGVAGPLEATEAYDLTFRTFPPLELYGVEPSGTGVNPNTQLTLKFSTHVPGDRVASRISIDPAPLDDWSPPAWAWASKRWSYGVRLQPRTTYTVTLAPGVEDHHGQQLGGSSWTFTTGDYDPWVHVPRGLTLYPSSNPLELPFRHLNVQTLRARIGSVKPEDLPTDGYAWDIPTDKLLGAGEPLTIETHGEVNHVQLGTLDLAPWLTRGHGLVAWKFWSPEVVVDGKPRSYTGMTLVTDLGATLKFAPGQTEVWVTRLSDGRPVPNAQVELYVGKEQVATAQADAQGLAAFQGQPGWEWTLYGDQPLWAIARSGDDWTVVNHEWRYGIEPWGPGVYRSWASYAQRAVSHGFLDRGVYRPGDPVYARVTFRLQTAQGLEIPSAEKGVTWSFRDPQGTVVQEGEGTLDDRGGVDVRVEVPAEGALGDYTLRVWAKGETWEAGEWLSVSARAYRAPAFRVSVDGPAEAIAGQEIQATVDARYLFGAPLHQAEVTWRTWTEPQTFRPKGWDGFSFGPAYRWWDDEELPDSRVLDSQTAALQGGRHAFVHTLPSGDSDRPQTWHLEAEVVDTDRQAIASRAEVLVHPAHWYIGLRPTSRLPQASKPVEIEVVGVRPDGEVQARGEVTLRALRRTWNRVREKGLDGQWRWVNQPVETEVATEALTLASQPAPFTFTPEEPGYYIVQAEGQDEAGNPVRASDALYVTGAGSVAWALSDDSELELVPDKELYKPGDTAQILVKSPAPGLSALVTLEREGILYREVVQLDSTASVIEVPITAEHRPNVYVSVVVVTGAGPQDAPDKGRPEVRVGVAALSVDSEDEHLQVQIRTNAETYRPRDTVRATVEVRKGGRALSGAGVTLYAVDEAVLSLTGYQTPDAHGTFYAPHALLTRTADGRLKVLNRAPYLTKGAPRGGGGGEEEDGGVDARSRFLTTIHWDPDLRTQGDGTVTTSFELPDNLTTFRIMAVVDHGATAFGSGEEEIRVSRPLIARPALPRFLRAGDVAFAGVVVHNNTAQARQVVVTGQVEGPVDLQGSPQTVTVPAHGALEVPFRVQGLEEGKAAFTFTVEGGGERDAVRWTLPVQRLLTFETVASTGSTTDRVMERIARPDGALSPFGGLTVDVASTVLVGAGSGLDYLVDYPHGSVEHITSRALAALVALQIREAAGIEASEAALQEIVASSLSRLEQYDHHSGGVAYWPGSGWASPMGTAYVVELMGRAREAGLPVDEARLERHVGYLRRVLAGEDLRGWDPLTSLAARAYVAVALARAGHGDAGHNNTLYGSRRDLSVLATASLLEAIARTTGPDARTAALEQAILSRLTLEAAGASVKENQSRRWAALWASDDLSTAAALEALLVARGEHPMAEKLARHLASSRRSGRWHNTRATAGVLAALARYSSVMEAAGQPVEVSLSLAGDVLLSQSLEFPDAAQVALALPDVRNGELFIGATGGRLYYDARLSYVPRELPARDEGFTVRRSFEVLDGGGDGGSVTSGALLRVTLQVVTPVPRHSVALVDPLPAGLEPVETSFVTSSQAPQQRGESPAGNAELPFGGSWAFDHHELRDDQVRLYASYMAPGIHSWRYVVRATSPGVYEHPPVRVEEMYEPENFGRTAAGTFTVGRSGLASAD